MVYGDEMAKDKPLTFSREESVRRMEIALRAALSTPPQPRKSTTPKRPEAQRKKTKSAKRAS